MNSKQHRSTYREVDQIDRKIMKQIQSLRQLQKFSSRVSTKTPTTTSNHPHKPPPSSSKILQIKPSSKGQKGYTISEVKIGHTTKPKNRYQDIETTKNKENNPRNPMNDLTEYHKKKQVGYGKVQKHASGAKGKEHLKTEMSTKQDEEVGYFGNNRNHYVSANVMNQNLFQNYDLSDSEGEEGELFPEDSLNFSLKEEVPRERERNWNGGSRQAKGLKQDFLDLLEIEGYSQTNTNNIKAQSRTKRRDNERAAQCTFKPTILDKSKQIAERLGSSYTRLTKSKNPTKQNTYRQNPTKPKTYSKQRLNTLSKPRPIPTETQQQITDQCTFKPVLSKKSLNHFNGCYLDITERSTLWQNQRRQKIEKIRESNEQMKNDKMRMECSAVKIRNNYNPNQQVAFSRFGKDGLIQYFERVNQVNEIKKRDKEMESKFSGKAWNGAITKPQEFKLSSNSTNELSYRSRGKSVTVNMGANNHSEKQYEKAVKQVHDKIRQLNLMI